MSRPFRFGHQLSLTSEIDPAAVALRAEQIGFDIVLAPDHIGQRLSPMPTLAAAAGATTSLRLGTFVINNEMRNPVHLAWEAATLDRLSGGRFELGLGAGHSPHEFAETGIAFEAPTTRKRRLAESAEIIRRLLDGETVSWHSDHYQLTQASTAPSAQRRLPILIGGNGAELLNHAGRHADIIGLQGLGRTRADGHRHEVKWTAEWLDHQLVQIQQGASTRLEDLELNALVQIAEVTDHPATQLAEVSDRSGVEVADLEETPYVLIGSVDEIVEKMHRVRSRWGISYFVVRQLDDFAEVIAAARR